MARALPEAAPKPALPVSALPAEIRELEQSHRNFEACHKASTECAICLEEIGADDDTRTLACGHRFHQACLKPSTHRCPMCRAFCSPQEGEAQSITDIPPAELVRIMLGYCYVSRATDRGEIDGGDALATAALGERFVDDRLAAASPILSLIEQRIAETQARIRQSRSDDSITGEEIIAGMVEACGLALGEELITYSPYLSRWLREVFD